MVQNIFDAHADALGFYQKETVQSLAQPDPAQGQPGMVTYAGKVIPAIIGIFEVVQRLVTGGVEESLDAFVYLRKADMIAAGVNCTPRNGQTMLVTQPMAPTRTCQVAFANDKYSFWAITVSSVNERAGGNG